MYDPVFTRRYVVMPEPTPEDQQLINKMRAQIIDHMDKSIENLIRGHHARDFGKQSTSSGWGSVLPRKVDKPVGGITIPCA